MKRDTSVRQGDLLHHINANNESSGSFSHIDEEHPSEEKGVQLAKSETRAVLRLRLAVVLVLVASVIGVAFAVHSFAVESETTRFHDQFQNDAVKVMEAVGSTLDKSMGAFDALAVTLVSMAQAMNQTWPFVTLPNYGMHVSKILPLSKAIYIQLNPLVTPENRVQWEEYAQENQYWVDETMKLQEHWKGYYGPVIYNWTANEEIFADFSSLPYDLERPYMPVWQSFPVIPAPLAPYNWDWLSQGSPQSIYACIENQTTVMSEAYMIPDPSRPGSFEEEEAWATYYKDYIPKDEVAMEPVSDLFYPIIDQLDHIDLNDAKKNETSTGYKFVGMIAASIYWRALIKDILPSESKGVVVVFTNPCNLPFTYQINGGKVEYLGVGDLHDPSYDDIAIHSELGNLNVFSEHASEYSGVPLDPYCPFTLNVYPSDTMRDIYLTNTPLTYTVAAVMIFVFTSMVFLLYDYMVERRQKLVMNTAVRTNAIVSSLFPEAVRDKLYPQDADQNNNSDDNENARKTFRRTESDMNASLTASPIAELYPETTVLFCDIAGFTAWSASRQPWEVFHLLETIYGEFDQIARKRRVFKVETIGDCYVAVVGLPTPRLNHATVMARFARDCRAKMHEILPELEEKLGEGTSNLALRFGLNSGPTTAGVLRGEKGRFQLFGDTVNTAARMESNSERNRIQVSQSTADLLIADGKRHWLTPRKDLVNAKGKGLMQTYWCEPKSGGMSSSVLDSSADSLPDADLDDDVDHDIDHGMDSDVRDVEKAICDAANEFSTVPEPSP